MDKTSTPDINKSIISSTDAGNVTSADTHPPTSRPDLPEAAKRALAEAEARRKAAKPSDMPVELGGRDGPEPVRYGDWERKGVAVDF